MVPSADMPALLAFVGAGDLRPYQPVGGMHSASVSVVNTQIHFLLFLQLAHR